MLESNVVLPLAMGFTPSASYYIMRHPEYVTILKHAILLCSSRVYRTMRLVIQRVSEAKVMVEGRTQGSIRTGMLVLVGVSRLDDQETARYCADKLLGLR